MRRELVLVLCTACVHNPPLTGEEFCGMQNMVLEGTSGTTSSSSGVALQYGRQPAFSSGDSVSTTWQCRRPTTRQDACEVRAASESGPMKTGFGAGGKNVVIVVGLFALVLPGVIASVAFSSQQGSVASEANATYQKTYGDCMAGDVAIEHHGWWCTNVENADDGVCVEHEDGCIKSRSDRIGRGDAMGACYESTSAVCYPRGDGKNCAPTLTACQRRADGDPNRIGGCSEQR